MTNLGFQSDKVTWEPPSGDLDKGRGGETGRTGRHGGGIGKDRQRAYLALYAQERELGEESGIDNERERSTTNN